MLGFGNRHGWIYVDDSHHAAKRFAGAAAGDVIRIPDRNGPWLVVDRAVESVIVARWPGRLWRAEVIDMISEAEERKAGSERTAEGRARYWRAAAIRLKEAIPSASMFGAQGARVAAVVDRAHALTRKEAVLLHAARGAQADEVREAVWQRWMAGAVEAELHIVDSHGNKLAASGGNGGRGAPLGPALSLIDGEVSRQARAIDGEAAMVTYPDDPEGAWLVDPWAGASAGLCDAALAFGAGGLMTPEGRDILAAAWRAVFGADPG